MPSTTARKEEESRFSSSQEERKKPSSLRFLQEERRYVTSTMDRKRGGKNALPIQGKKGGEEKVSPSSTSLRVGPKAGGRPNLHSLESIWKGGCQPDQEREESLLLSMVISISAEGRKTMVRRRTLCNSYMNGEGQRKKKEGGGGPFPPGEEKKGSSPIRWPTREEGEKFLGTLGQKTKEQSNTTTYYVEKG